MGNWAYKLTQAQASFDRLGEILKLGKIPVSSSIASSKQVKSYTNNTHVGIYCLRDEGKSYEGDDLEQVMRAYHKTEEAASWDLVPLIVLLPQLRKEVVVIQVATDSDEKEN